MKKSKAISDGKFLGALVAIASGIITELIYDIISTSHYEVIISEQNIDYSEILITEINKYGLFQRVSFVIIVFGLACIVMSIIIPQLINFIKIRRIHTRKILTTKQIVYEYYSIKKEIVDLLGEIAKFDVVYTDGEKDKNKLIDKYRFAFKENIIVYCNQLYNIFKCSSVKGEKVINASFRESGKEGLAGRYIAKEDYANLIDIIESLLNDINAIEKTHIDNERLNEDEETNDEYTNLERKLNYLKTIIK